MNEVQVWLNVMAQLSILFFPILFVGGVLLVTGFILANKIRSLALSSILIIMAVLVVMIIGIAWIETLVRPCGYLDRHFPTEEHINGYCEPVR